MEILTKKEAEKIMKIEGNVRGEGILTDVEYLQKREGEKGVKKVEEKLAELGYPIKFKEIQSLDWYPQGFDVLKMLVMKELFNWTDKDIFKMATFAPQVSFLVRMLIKYFLSAKKSFEQSPNYWKQHFDFGELEAYEFSEKEKRIVFRIKNYKTHPVMCVVLAGYFLQMSKYVLKSKEVTIKETKCMFKGDPYHEYVVNWT